MIDSLPTRNDRILYFVERGYSGDVARLLAGNLEALVSTRAEFYVKGLSIEFSVTDSGPGIKDEVISRLYEAFFSTKVDGMGIGLSLCREFAGLMHGQMGVHSEPGRGSTFAASFPVVGDDARRALASRG